MLFVAPLRRFPLACDRAAQENSGDASVDTWMHDSCSLTTVGRLLSTSLAVLSSFLG
jgi:hypothetical protein